MTAYVDILDSTIYEIEEIWTGWDDLQYANDALKSSPKGLQFFCHVSSSESPKVTGLKGIYHPDALCQVNLLPLVWKRGAEWGNHCQPFVDNALQAGAILWQVSLLPLNHFRGHTASQLRLQAAQGK